MSAVNLDTEQLPALGSTQGLHRMGLIVATIQCVLFWLQTEWD